MKKELKELLHEIINGSEALRDYLKNADFPDIWTVMKTVRKLDKLRADMLKFITEYPGYCSHLFKAQNLLALLEAAVVQLLEDLDYYLHFNEDNYLENTLQECNGKVLHMVGLVSDKALTDEFTQHQLEIHDNIDLLLRLLQSYYNTFVTNINDFKDWLNKIMAGNDQLIMEYYEHYRVMNAAKIRSEVLALMMRENITQKNGKDPTPAQWGKLMNTMMEEIMPKDPVTNAVILSMTGNHRVDMSCNEISAAVRTYVTDKELAEHYMMQLAMFNLVYDVVEELNKDNQPKTGEVDMTELRKQYIRKEILESAEKFDLLTEITKKLIAKKGKKSVVRVAYVIKTYHDDGVFVELPNDTDAARLMDDLNRDPDVNVEALRSRIKDFVLPAKDRNDRYTEFAVTNKTYKACAKVHKALEPLLKFFDEE